MIPIQTNISGFSGRPCTLFSIYDPEKMILLISQEIPLRHDRYENSVLVSNDINSNDRDVLFSDDYFSDAIRAFFSLKNGVSKDNHANRLIFSDKASRTTPDSALDRDGYSEGGAKYTIMETITNAQMAVLATCYYVEKKVNAIEKTMAMFDLLGVSPEKSDIDKIMAGEVITV